LQVGAPQIERALVGIMTRQIGPYQITRELGRGGMGVVYLASDTRLDRQVAIKALPPVWASDPLRLDRFQREAKTLASLNHPKVAGIYGVEEHEGSHYLVLEYVEGQTLAEMLDRGPLAVDDVIELAVQIAEGVEAAHEAGVIHRDLKPANIIVTPDGKAKILDFGLARTDDLSSSSAPSLSPDSPTITSPAAQHSPTMPGVILGTAAYMSPEQARGRKVDKRTDIWSFGVVLYEMLTGASPFVGETVSDSIGAVLHKELDLDRLPRQTPANVRRILDRCLVRDRNLRFRDIGDVRVELLRADEEKIREEVPVRSIPMWFIPVAVVGLIAGAAVAWLVKPTAQPSPPAVVQSDIALPGDLKLAHSFVPGITISADGRTLAFAAGAPDAGRVLSDTDAYFRGGLYVRRLGEPDAMPVAGAEGAWQPAFSPDGSRVAYVKRDNRYRGKIETIAVTGGRPTTLASSDSGIFGLDWSQNGRIVFGSVKGLRSIPAAGGSITDLTSTSVDDQEMLHAFPQVLPGGKGILYSVALENLDPTEITLRVLDTASGESRELLKNASNARYARGHVVFARDHTLHAVPFNLETMTLGGEPQPLGLSVVQSHSAPNSIFVNGAAQFTVSETGDLMFAHGSNWPELPRPLAWVDSTGSAELIDLKPGCYDAPRVDAAGRRLLLSNFYRPNKAIWMHDLARGVTSRVRRDANFGWVCWGPGPDDYTFRVDASGIPRVGWATVGSMAKPFIIDPPPGVKFMFPVEWSPDRLHLLVIAVPERSTKQELFAWSEEDGWLNLTETTSTSELWPTFSPDGRWIAYVVGDVNNSPDELRVHVRPFLRDGPAIQVSTTPSSSPLWSSDGTQLYYVSRVEAPKEESGEATSGTTEKWAWVTVVSVTLDDTEIEIGRPEWLFQADDYVEVLPIRSWDMGPDGRFLMPMKSREETIQAAIDAFFPERIRLIQNWANTLDKPRP